MSDLTACAIVGFRPDFDSISDLEADQRPTAFATMITNRF
jgi:hypothetical protein